MWNLKKKSKIVVNMIEFSAIREDVDRTMAETALHFYTCTVIFSGFLDAVMKQFLSKEKLLSKRRKQSFP